MSVFSAIGAGVITVSLGVLLVVARVIIVIGPSSALAPPLVVTALTLPLDRYVSDADLFIILRLHVVQLQEPIPGSFPRYIILGKFIAQSTSEILICRGETTGHS